MFWTKNNSKIVTREQVELGGSPKVSLELRPSTRARRLSLRISKLDGRVTLTVPRGTLRNDAIGFAEERAGWIREHLSEMSTEVSPKIGDKIPFLGQPHLLINGNNRVAKVELSRIVLPKGDGQTTAVRLEALLKREARNRLVEASDRYAREIGREFGRITLRDTRSRWGSCSAEGNLMYSWRLVMAPEEVLDYVAAHEVAHLKYMDHSKSFWGLVETICPEYRAPRRWLRDNGAELHRYRFRDT